MVDNLPLDFPINTSDKKREEIEERLATVLRDWTPKKLQEKTELTPKERFILPLLKIIATNPYPQWSLKSGKKLRSKPLLDFINDYDSRGLSVKRQSRTEMRDIFSGVLDYIKSKFSNKDDTPKMFR